jgi:hypothetical protein
MATITGEPKAKTALAPVIQFPERKTVSDDVCREMEDQAVRIWNEDQQSAHKFGHALIALREVYEVRYPDKRMRAKAFQTFLNTNKITRGRALYALAVATGKRAKTMKKVNNSPKSVLVSAFREIGVACWEAAITNDVETLGIQKKKVTELFDQLEQHLVATKAS